MTDPLSVTASLIGISSFALSSIKELRDFINGLAEADNVVREIRSSLDNIQRPLSALEELKVQDEQTLAVAKENFEKVGVIKAVDNCGNSCHEFTEKLQKWTKHSGPKKLSFGDRFVVGVWKSESINTFKDQLQRCQATAHFAVGTFALYVTLNLFIIYRERISFSLYDSTDALKDLYSSALRPPSRMIENSSRVK